jgi:Flp pilus assembly protein TadG
MTGRRWRWLGGLRRISNEDGQALILFTAGLVLFCGLVGMSIDVGQIVFTRTDVQKIADASALAGSQDLPGSTTNATTSADQYASKNGASSTVVTFGSSNTTITVKATRHVDYTFLKVLGMSGRDVSASATAKTTQINITGYSWAAPAVAPFVIWGGKQQKPSPADNISGCTYHTCVGNSYTFWSNQWLKDSGTPIAPDWTAANSNNFKGDVQHGAGAPGAEIGDFFSDGGNGSAVTPVPLSTIVVPVVDKASNGSSSRQFHIVAWVVIQVDPGCNKGGNKPCTGKVLSPATTTPPPGYDGNGSVAPPSSLDYTSTTTRLIA